MAEIYGLYSARDGKVRYVGQTTGSREVRFAHARSQIGRFITEGYTWIHAEWRCSFPVECALLEKCNDNGRYDVEIKWIGKFPNFLNERKYYFRGGDTPVIPEIKNYMRSHIFNCGGFRGIHYWKGIERYAVFIYTIYGIVEWLPGDGAPDWGGNIFFSDRTEALKARDRYRQHQKHMTWLPDITQEVDWYSLFPQLDTTFVDEWWPVDESAALC